jgi:Na+-driven multidrug efflux pump
MVSDKNSSLGDTAYELATVSPLRLLIKYSWPALVAMSLNALYTVVDRFYIGHGCGENAMAALTLCFPVMLFFAAFGVFVGAGHSAVLSIKFGEKDITACQKILGQLVAFKLAFFFVLPPLVFFNLDFVLSLCGGAGVNDETFSLAKTYLSIVVFSNIFSHLAFGLSAALRAEGAAIASMMAIVIGFSVNLLLDPFFIFSVVKLPLTSVKLPGLGLGVAGAAWATVAGMFASFCFAIWYYLSGRAQVKLMFENIAFHRNLIAKPCAVGFAPFFQQFLGAAINVVLPLAFVKWAPDKASANAQIASLGVFQSVMILIILPILGTQQGLQPIIGYNWGARNFKRVKITLISGLTVTTVLCIIACIVQVVPFFAKILVSLFVSSSQPHLFEMAVSDLRISNCMLWCISLNIVATTYFLSIGHPTAAIILSTLRQGICLMPLAWFLPYLFEDKSFAVWLSLPVSDVLCCIMTIVPFFLHLRFLSRVKERQ